MHAGVDWAAPRGTPIIAAGDGVIERAGWASGYGNLTIIRHANGYSTRYGHQSAFAKGIKPGVRVHQGADDRLCRLDRAFYGPHVHFEIRINGQAVNPLRVRLPQRPVPSRVRELEAFERERRRIDVVLSDDGQDARQRRRAGSGPRIPPSASFCDGRSGPSSDSFPVVGVPGPMTAAFATR